MTALENSMLSDFSLYFPRNQGDLLILDLNPLKNTERACCALIAMLIMSIASPLTLPKYLEGSLRQSSLYTRYAHPTVDVKSLVTCLNYH